MREKRAKRLRLITRAACGRKMERTARESVLAYYGCTPKQIRRVEALLARKLAKV